MHIDTVYKHESHPAVFALQAAPLVINNERQPCRCHIDTTRSIFHGRADPGLSVWSGGGGHSCQGLWPAGFCPRVWPSSLPFWVTWWYAMGLTWFLKKSPITAKEKITVWEEYLFPSRSIGPWFFWSILDLASVFCQAPSLNSCMIWDKSSTLLASLFLSRKYRSQWLIVITRTEVCP